jgi:hypothetical protein
MLVLWHPDLPSARPFHSLLAITCPFSSRIKLCRRASDRHPLLSWRKIP